MTDTLAPLIDPDEVVNEIEILDSSSSDSDLSFDDDDDQDDSKDLSCCERFRKSKFFCLVLLRMDRCVRGGGVVVAVFAAKQNKCD